jgi:hypothetical protein
MDPRPRRQPPRVVSVIDGTRRAICAVVCPPAASEQGRTPPHGLSERSALEAGAELEMIGSPLAIQAVSQALDHMRV